MTRLETFDTPTEDSDLILDPQALDKLEIIMPRERLIQLATSYLNGIIARVERITAMSAGGDLSGLAREAHDLKSTSGSFGARRLHRLAESLDMACRTNDLTSLPQLTALIVGTLPDTIEAVIRRYPEIRLSRRT